ncbi:MAG TPA: DUF5696 domain-containing protein [Bryobacteraceae bacterium]|nr:DUF5696 domain-containing protein [Bryobacteraceae bacterium]HOQ48093.1 DUF5696 domain-containing protein [Bryobacteraceae bacterium]
MKRFLNQGSLMLLIAVSLPAADTARLENRRLRVEVDRADAAVRLLDKETGEAWALGAPRLVMQDKSTATIRPSGKVTERGGTVRYRTEQGIEFQLQLLANPPSVEYSFDKAPPNVAEVLLVDKGLALGPGVNNYYALPVRMGILLYPEGEKPYTRRLANYAGYSMAMLGVVKNGSALLTTWSDPYTTIVVDYAVEPRKNLSLSLSLQKSARSVRFEPLGRGGYVEIAKAYRPVARQRGYLKTLAEKMKENPGVARFFGAANFKPFAFVRNVPNTRWNQTDKERLNINFTFEECADLAEHFARDLGIDRALLVLNGWINGGYDNRHPDVLPAAPEIGGDRGLMECSRRVHALGPGWVFGLHDNYQDFYRDAPSWNEDYIMKNPDGSLRQGGVWAGGQAYLICSRKSVELASRPQNVPRVKELFKPDLYFSDTIFASPLYECFDPKHPMTWVDDLHYKTQLCIYLRKEVGLFGSEEGREWGVAHSDYFEGLMSHKTRWQQQRPNDDIIVPLFEIVYGDAIPMYTHQSDRPRIDAPNYVLDHVLYAEMPVYDFGTHRYWTGTQQPQRQRGVDESRTVFARGDRFSDRRDQFIKNTYEVLSPLGRVTALLPMTDHRFLTPDRKVESTRFGTDVNITVNYGEADYATPRAVLPQYGFIVESPTLIAFYARSYRGLKYDDPALFVLRSMDDRPLVSSRKVRIYHGFGGNQVEFRGKVLKVDREQVISGAEQ